MSKCDGDDDSGHLPTAGEQRAELHRWEQQGNPFSMHQRARVRGGMRAELRSQQLPSRNVQQIICYYMQRQQRSYFVNNASEDINLDDYEYDSDEIAEAAGNEQAPYGQEPEAPADSSHQLSQYELDRLERIKEHQAFLISLSLNNASSNFFNS